MMYNIPLLYENNYLVKNPYNIAEHLEAMKNWQLLSANIVFSAALSSLVIPIIISKSFN